jgi:hypothetical protein
VDAYIFTGKKVAIVLYINHTIVNSCVYAGIRLGTSSREGFSVNHVTTNALA